jgi:hypothetical protein
MGKKADAEDEPGCPFPYAKSAPARELIGAIPDVWFLGEPTAVTTGLEFGGFPHPKPDASEFGSQASFVGRRGRRRMQKTSRVAPSRTRNPHPPLNRSLLSKFFQFLFEPTAEAAALGGWRFPATNARC